MGASASAAPLGPRCCRSCWRRQTAWCRWGGGQQGRWWMEQAHALMLRVTLQHAEWGVSIGGDAGKSGDWVASVVAQLGAQVKRELIRLLSCCPRVLVLGGCAGDRFCGVWLDRHPRILCKHGSAEACGTGGELRDVDCQPPLPAQQPTAASKTLQRSHAHNNPMQQRARRLRGQAPRLGAASWRRLARMCGRGSWRRCCALS